MWLSLTYGDVENKLGRPDHWAKDIEVKKGVWRDYYTGKQLMDYNITWDEESESYERGNFSHCVLVTLTDTWKWLPGRCLGYFVKRCPCEDTLSYGHKHFPLILRGVCSFSHLRAGDFVRGLVYNPQQISGLYKDISFTGGMSSHIEYDSTKKQWVLTEINSGVRAVSLAKKSSYVLGKHNWTIHNDSQLCQAEKGHIEDEVYRTELKLSGCNQGFEFDFFANMLIQSKAEFTCNDGQCVDMNKRCDQLHDCSDGSDEEDCNLITLGKGYDKQAPPFSRTSLLNATIVPVSVNVSMKIFKLSAINEEENTIDMQFEVILEWIDYRLTYNNLKTDLYLNALSDVEMRSLWLPLVIYENTDQKETTRLGWTAEWKTTVVVEREGQFTR